MLPAVVAVARFHLEATASIPPPALSYSLPDCLVDLCAPRLDLLAMVPRGLAKASHTSRDCHDAASEWTCAGKSGILYYTL